MKNEKPKHTSFLEDGNLLYELIGSTNEDQQFICFDRTTEKLDLVSEIHVGEITYVPPRNDLVSNGTIKLPTYPSEFESIEVLFESIKQIISKYVDIPNNFLTISALYVILTWVYDCFSVLPYIRVIGDFGTGKSRYLKVVGSLCYRGCSAAGATTISPIFRIISIYQGITLLFDEADFSFSGPESEMIKILNCGYADGTPVLRTEGDGNNRQPVSYRVFGPKILGTRCRYDDLALESRCLTHIMTGKVHSRIPSHLPKTFDTDALELRNKLLMFRLRNYGRITIDESQAINGVDARTNQIILPILSLISNQNVQNEIYEFVQQLTQSIKDSRTTEQPALLLKALIQLIKEKASLQYSNLAERINLLSDHTFGGWEISPAKIGRINRSSLNLITREINGKTEFVLSQENLKKLPDLVERYGIKVDDVDFIDVLKEGSEMESRPFFIEEVKQALF